MVNIVALDTGGGRSLFRRAREALLRPHPDEMPRGMRFVEEARGERLANIIRTLFACNWLITTGYYVIGNPPSYNVINMVSGFTYLSVAVGYHAWLSVHPYRPWYKYGMATFDLLIGIGLMVAYAAVESPAFILKIPLYLNFLCSVGLAALRMHRGLALYAGGLTVVMLVGFWLFLHFWFGIEYGTRLEHTYGNKVNMTFLWDTLMYLVAFGFLTVVAAMNIRRQLELRVGEAERAAREEERALMAAGLAHEIRNPLGGIYGFAQMLRDEGRGSPKFIEAILGDARRLNGVVEGFLRLSRPYTAHPADLDLVAIVADFCRSDSAVHSDSPLDFRTTLPHLMIRTDAELVRQILHNLVRNARRFQPVCTPVRVRISGDSGEARVEVEDDGPGVSADRLATLFQPYQTAGEGGTGLGLTLSRRIARVLNGDLDLAPRSGHEIRGARFVLTLRPFAGQGDV